MVKSNFIGLDFVRVDDGFGGDFVTPLVVLPFRRVGVRVGAGGDNAVGVQDVQPLTEQFDDFVGDGFERVLRHRTYWCITICSAVKQVFSIFLLSYPRPQHSAQMVVIVQGGDEAILHRVEDCPVGYQPLEADCVYDADGLEDSLSTSLCVRLNRVMGFPIHKIFLSVVPEFEVLDVVFVHRFQSMFIGFKCLSHREPSYQRA